MSVFHRIDVTEVWRASEKTLTGLDKMQPRSHEEHEHETHETEQPQARKNTRALGGVRRTPRRGALRLPAEARQPSSSEGWRYVNACARVTGTSAATAFTSTTMRSRGAKLRPSGIVGEIARRRWCVQFLPRTTEGCIRDSAYPG